MAPTRKPLTAAKGTLLTTAAAIVAAFTLLGAGCVNSGNSALETQWAILREVENLPAEDRTQTCSDGTPESFESGCATALNIVSSLREITAESIQQAADSLLGREQEDGTWETSNYHRRAPLGVTLEPGESLWSFTLQIRDTSGNERVYICENNTSVALGGSERECISVLRGVGLS